MNGAPEPGAAGDAPASDRLVRHTAVVGSWTGLSRLLGFVREILMAALFGTSTAQSAFVVAFRIPNLFRRLFGEGALSSAFVPVFTDSLAHEGREAAWTLAGRVMALLSVVLSGIVLIGVAAATGYLHAGDPAPRTELVLALLRIMLPYMLCICLVALCMAVLNSFHHFLVPAATPVLLNVLWIGALVWVCPHFGETPEARIVGVAWAVLAAGVVQLAVQIPVLVRYGFRGRLSLRWRGDRRVWRVLALMGPAALGLGITQVNVVIDTLLALWIGSWAPAALSFSERLIYLPLGLFATALGTVLLPTFSHQAARNDPAGMRR
ncbi:MAG: murein biosynthesis integral membrane protein MurJ, partial [Lentisphaerae bacterium]|nr:murein biosynthesis integral membrane protein MurJ [Lentisphaerota bacterium]